VGCRGHSHQSFAASPLGLAVDKHELSRRILVDWATDMDLVPACALAAVDGYIGDFEPYATSHDALDNGGDF
jgi:hypothetical protein